jgi:lipid-A-disaccharide synthase
VIFPFEVEFFKKYDFDVEFVGNPLFDAIDNFEPSTDFLQRNNLSDKKIIALLPGSRKQEVEKMLKLMVDIQIKFSDYQFVIAGVSNLPVEFYQPFLNENIRLVTDQTYDLLSQSTAALVTSGTATLETALFEIPQVVCYKTSGLSYKIAKLVIKVPYISLVNLVAQKEVVKELIQDELTIENLSIELNKILNNTDFRNKQMNDYKQVKDSLGDIGASEKTGRRIVEILRSSN